MQMLWREPVCQAPVGAGVEDRDGLEALTDGDDGLDYVTWFPVQIDETYRLNGWWLPPPFPDLGFGSFDPQLLPLVAWAYED